jgi:hypothetical protein
MSETEMSPERRNDGWWTSLALRWGLLFWLNNAYFLFYGGNWGLRWAHLFSPDSINAYLLQLPHRLVGPYWNGVASALKWFSPHVLGFQIPAGQFRSLVIDILGTILLPFIWTIFDRRNRSNIVLREVLYLGVRCWLATGMFLYGSSKLMGHQGISQPAPLEWFRPLGEISTGQLMWTWLGYSRTFQFFAGVNETVGAILLVFRRTTLMGAFLILPVMAYVTVLDLTFQVGPWAGAFVYGVGALYLIGLEWRRFAGVFFLAKPTAPSSPNKLLTSPRLALVGRGIWVVIVAFGLWSYVLPRFKMNADIGGRQSPLCGAYRVERFVSDGHVLPEEARDPARWREVAINWFGDYIRIRRMDNAELLWSADPGDPYRFLVASGHDYHYGDYGRILAKTAGPQEQLRFREMPNYGSPHTAALLNPDTSGRPAVFNPNYSRGEFFAVNLVRHDSDYVSMQGRIDGADISADLVRVANNNFAFFKTREGLP